MQHLLIYLLSLVGAISIIALLRTRRQLIGYPAPATTTLAVVATLGSVLADTSWVSAAASTVQIAVVTAIMVLLLSALLLVKRSQIDVEDCPTRYGALIAAGCLWAWLLAQDVIHNDLSPLRLVARVSTGLILYLLALVLRATRIRSEQFAFAIALCISLIALLLPLTPDAWRPCDEFKCGTFGAMLRGPFTSENFLAIQLVFACILTAIYFRGRVRLVCLSLQILMLVATDARTSMLVAAVALTVIAGSHLVRGNTRATLRPLLAIAIAGALCAVGVFLILQATPTSFSTRGAIWIQGYSQVQGHLLGGLGADRWEVLLSSGLVPDHFEHSSYLYLIFSGGYVALALYAAWLAICIYAAAQDIRLRPFTAALPAIALGAIGWTEVVWNPLTFDGLAWTALLVTITAVSGRTRADSPSDMSPGGRQTELAVALQP